jgi:serine/threonine protein kinase
VVHRNICPQHILVDENFFDVRICGFGHCRTLPEENIKKGNSRRIREALRENPDIFNNEKDLRKQIARKLHKRREGLAEKKRMLSCDFGQRFYRAPEVLQMSRHYDFAVDVWSLGLTMAEAAKAFNLEANFPIFFDEAAFLFNKKVRKENLPLYQGISAHPISPRSVNNDEKRDKKEVTKINH